MSALCRSARAAHRHPRADRFRKIRAGNPPCRKLGGEILVCDSTQVYRHFDIGTGKVPLAEQRGIPHHLVDLVEPDEVFTAGEYRRRALDVLEDVRRRGKVADPHRRHGALSSRAARRTGRSARALRRAARPAARKSRSCAAPNICIALLARLDAKPRAGSLRATRRRSFARSKCACWQESPSAKFIAAAERASKATP